LFLKGDWKRGVRSYWPETRSTTSALVRRCEVVARQAGERKACRGQARRMLPALELRGAIVGEESGVRQTQRRLVMMSLKSRIRLPHYF